MARINELIDFLNSFKLKGKVISHTSLTNKLKWPAEWWHWERKSQWWLACCWRRSRSCRSLFGILFDVRFHRRPSWSPRSETNGKCWIVFNVFCRRKTLTTQIVLSFQRNVWKNVSGPNTSAYCGRLTTYQFYINYMVIIVVNTHHDHCLEWSVTSITIHLIAKRGVSLMSDQRGKLFKAALQLYSLH